eukprot:CAMPEP_0119414488 /NCGR_PEP_ID=MMETSP1335-20130426/7024_1 /TAXON_ID=259385 /ORGANISM="Chrysoculter rhomboideus, Strain RCC1486" /LENGTH=97 /DNA_ID=CAMNT_0007439369 /DNA_START=137 /DNA_END=430 /DNA_ORIENTATION=+
MTDEKACAIAQEKVIRKTDRVAQRDRQVDTSVRVKKHKLSGIEKRVRSLNKKLREIETLQQRADRGHDLDAQQQAKLATLGDLLAELDELGVNDSRQ